MANFVRKDPNAKSKVPQASLRSYLARGDKKRTMRSTESQRDEPPAKKAKFSETESGKILARSDDPSDEDSPLRQESDSDDEILALTKRKKKRYALPRNLPEVNVRSSKRNKYTSDTDDLKRELNLSDSDSETVELLDSMKSIYKATGVRHNFNSLVKDLSNHKSTTEERQHLEKEIKRRLSDSADQSENSDHFSLIPGTESLQFETMGYYEGTDLEWAPRYSFSNWDGSDLASFVSIEQFMEALKDCDNILEKIMRGYCPKGHLQDLLSSNCLFSSLWTLPHSVLDWIFDIVCYSDVTDPKLLPCYNYLCSILSNKKNTSKACLFSASCVPWEGETPQKPQNTWRVSYQQIMRVLERYGLPELASSESLAEDSTQMYSLSPPKNQSFPIQNFKYFIHIVELSIQNSSFEQEKTERLLQLVSGFLIDPLLSTLTLQLQSLFQLLLTKLQGNEEWTREEFKRVCGLIANPAISEDLCHMAQIGIKLPLGPTNSLSRLFVVHFAFRVLQNSLYTFDENNTYHTREIMPKEVVQIVHELVENVQREKEEKTQVDYTRLYAHITLLDLSLDKSILTSQENRNICNELNTSLTELNLAIPDASGIVISRTRVKEYISRLSGCVLMVQAMGKAERTSAQDRTNLVITSFFTKK